jgi:hypothetical protein
MPYEQAMVLAQGDPEAVARSRQLLTQFGAKEVIALLAREKKTKSLRSDR